MIVPGWVWVILAVVIVLVFLLLVGHPAHIQ